MSMVTKTLTHERLSPRRYSDGEEYFSTDWEKIIPEKCSLDYNSFCHGTKRYYAEIYDLVTGTPIARTRWYDIETSAFIAAENIINYLKREYYFEASVGKKKVPFHEGGEKNHNGNDYNPN